MISVLIADDNAVIREGLEGLLRRVDGMTVVGTAPNGRVAVELAAECEVDVVLLDVRMPVMDGIRAAELLAKRSRVLMLTYSESDDAVVDALRAGASGYLVHGTYEPDELLTAIREVAAGRSALSPSITPVVVDALRHDRAAPVHAPAEALTPREREVMNLIAQGRSNREIARALTLSDKTVKNHVTNVYTKLHVSSRSEAIALWLGVRDRNRSTSALGHHE